MTVPGSVKRRPTLHSVWRNGPRPGRGEGDRRPRFKLSPPRPEIFFVSRTFLLTDPLRKAGGTVGCGPYPVNTSNTNSVVPRTGCARHGGDLKAATVLLLSGTMAKPGGGEGGGSIPTTLQGNPGAETALPCGTGGVVVSSNSDKPMAVVAEPLSPAAAVVSKRARGSSGSATRHC